MDTFIWKPTEQRQYYDTVCNKYLRGIFQYINNKQYMFYLDNNITCMQDNVKFLTQRTVDIDFFHREKRFKYYKTFPKYEGTYFHDVDELNIGFTISGFDEATEYDLKGISGRCGQCEERYGGGFNFWGKAFNTGLDEENPIDYEGYIKTYDFNSCQCERRGKMNDIICRGKDDFPFVEMKCTPILDKELNILIMRPCILFDIGFTDILSSGNLIPFDEKDIVEF